MIQQLIALLGSELDLAPEEIADLLWLTLQRQKRSQTVDSASVIAQENTSVTTTSPLTEQPIDTTNIAEEDLATLDESPFVDIYTLPSTTSSPTTQEGYIPISVPDAPSVRKPLDFIRALKPLSKKVPSSTEKVIDEPATVDWIAQTDIWMPILQPKPELWLELALVIDESDSMILWRHTVRELQQILKHYGIFRDVRVWGMGQDDGKQVYLRSQARSCSHKELIDPQNRRLIMLVSDFTDDLWRNPQTISILADWTESNPVVLLQMLPPWMWSRTALSSHTPARFCSNGESILNQKFVVEVNRLAKRRGLDRGINLPLITFESELAKNWSRIIAQYSLVSIPGYVLRKDLLATEAAPSSQTMTARERVSNFNVNASPLARELASLLAAAPVITMPVVRLIIPAIFASPKRDKFTQLQIAEVFLGGLLKPTVKITRETEPERAQYEFIDGVRKELLESTPIPESEKVFLAVSRYIAARRGKSLQEFFAFVRKPDRSQEQDLELAAFAKVAKEILPQLGYQFFPEETEVSKEESLTDTLPLPELKTLTFDVATIEIQETRIFEFSVATFARQPSSPTPEGEESFSILMPSPSGYEELGGIVRVINCRKQQGTAIIEVLEPDVELELIEIPGGSFIMGAPEDELGGGSSERPQHKVNVPTFLMGRYPITQAQWQVVAGWEQVERELDPDPSKFKKDYEGIDRWTRPVELISWYDAVEFCKRLSKKTSREYRLPTEAEWEYACRSVISHQSSVKSENLTVEEWNEKYYQPFHFGDTISPELANYDGNMNYTYGEGVKEKSREQTTPVGYFNANNLGLCDMHGNVWEWCEDYWHDNYEDAPDNGSAWLSGASNRKVVRGGSWYSNLSSCRSACRVFYPRTSRSNYFGFRVVCRS